jgi:putative copper export protein
LGGLVFLGLATGVARSTVPDRERVVFFRTLGRRFLVVAGIAALLLALTGTDMASDRLASWSALTDTDYGRELLAKTVLFAMALVEAAIHSFFLGPRIARLREPLLDTSDHGLQRELRRATAISGALSALMLVQTVAIFVIAADLAS